MLQKIRIQNYAIIEELEIDFSDKLNIITGETGAGKSIITGALGLILGDRADSSVLVNKEKKLIVEGLFSIAGKKEVADFLLENELDPEEDLLLRREIAANGKSRAFVNDTPVNLAVLQNLSSLLVDLHQQFDTLALGETDFQLQVIDALAANTATLAIYKKEFSQWQKEKQALDKLSAEKQQFEKEADYNRYQHEELSEAAFQPDELETIEQELKQLSNAEGIKLALAKVYDTLETGDSPIVQTLKTSLHQLTVFSPYYPDLEIVLRRLQSAQIELKDIAGEIDGLHDKINYDPQKIEQYNERLSVGYKLQKKHGVATTNELLAIQLELEKKLEAVLQIDEAILQQEKAVAHLFTQITKTAGALSAARNKMAVPLQEKVNQLMKQVGMPNAYLKVVITTTTLSIGGADDVAFLFDANRPVGNRENTTQLQPIRKVASGGELSRLMLCIKSLVAKSIDLPTLIFDEIDTGISGEAAKQVGIILKELATSRQIISITHQPQIAGKADAHYFVYKEIINDTVKTSIRRLSTEERILAIAKMLSGEKPTTAAMENAREMVMR